MVLVTGGTGFLGAYILYYLLGQGMTIRAIKRGDSTLSQVKDIFSYMDELSTGEGSKPDFNKIEWVEADILDVGSLEVAFEGIEQVYHSAAIVSYDPSRKKEMMDCNIRGTANMVNMAIDHEVKKFGYVSSIAAIHRLEGELSDEETRVDDYPFSSSYSSSKFYGEMEVWRGIAEGLNAVIINPGIILGPGDFSKGSPQIINAVKKSRGFYPAGANGFVDVRDVAKGIIHLMDTGKTGERYISISENLSYKTLFNMIAECTGFRNPFIKINPLLSNILLFISFMKSLVKNNHRGYTSGMADTICKRFAFNNNKILSTGFRFMPLEKSIRESCYIYKKAGH